MKENIVKNGARVISFAPDDESTNILGTVTSNYEFNGTTHYDIHTDDQKEGDIATFAVKADKGYTLKVTGKYNNRTGEFEYV